MAYAVLFHALWVWCSAGCLYYLGSENKHFKLLIRLFNIPINNNFIISPLLRILKLHPGPKTLLKNLKARRPNKHIPRINARVLQVLRTLHLNIKHHNQSPGSLLIDSPLTSTIVIPTETRILNKRAPFNQGRKLVPGYKEVGDTVCFAWSRLSRGVRDSESECAWVGGEETLDEGSFADVRGAGDDDGAAVLRGWISVVYWC